jgi:thiamine biosynthesis lipoprotein
VTTDANTQTVITTQNSFQLDTYITISIYDETQAPDDVFEEIFQRIDYYENMISKTIESSELAQVNAMAGIEPVAVSDDLYGLIEKGIYYGDVSNGKFDITIGPLVDLWGIGTDHAAVPDPADIEAAIQLIDYKKVELDAQAHTVYLTDPNMEIDLGGIAKGYIADQIKSFILSLGYDSAIINLGGNVLTVGTKPGATTWSIGIREPVADSTDLSCVLSLEDDSVVSSGVYERFFYDGDTRYHHILNPATGYPEQNDMLSVSIITPSSVDGDALSTTLFLMGLEDGYAYAQADPDIEALFIMSDGSIYMTSGLDSKFLLMNNNYHVEEMP